MSGLITQQELCAVLSKKIDDSDTNSKLNRQQIGALTSLKTTNKTNLVNSINELYNNTVNGKNLIGQAITQKGVSASGNDSYQTLHDKILQIKTGYNSGDILTNMSGFNIKRTDTGVVYIGRGDDEIKNFQLFVNGNNVEYFYVYSKENPTRVLGRSDDNRGLQSLSVEQYINKVNELKRNGYVETEYVFGYDTQINISNGLSAELKSNRIYNGYTIYGYEVRLYINEILMYLHVEYPSDFKRYVVSGMAAHNGSLYLINDYQSKSIARYQFEFKIK